MKLMNRSRPRTRRPEQNLRNRRGFSLVEVLVGLMMLSIAMLGTAGSLLHAARSASKLSVQNGQHATELQLLNRLAALSYGKLETAVGCKDVTATSFPHMQCISVSTVGTTKVLRIIITPTDSRVRPDTSYLTRSSGVAVSPLAN